MKPKTRKHGYAFRGDNDPTYSSWRGMKSRCLNPKDKRFHDYGGRGIAVCERWKNSFSNFLKDMGDRPDGKSLDRYPDKNGDYKPGNCRWATPVEQQNNTRRNRTVKFKGVTLTVSEWARKLQLPYERIITRLKRKWPLDRVFSRTIPKASPPVIIAKYCNARRRARYWSGIPSLTEPRARLFNKSRYTLAMRDCAALEKIIANLNAVRRKPYHCTCLLENKGKP